MAKEQEQERMRKWRATHREQTRVYNRKWREAHPEYMQKWREVHRKHESERNRRYRESHRDQILKRSRKYYWGHREEQLKYSRKYHKGHMDQVRERFRNLKLEVLSYYSGGVPRCAKCGIEDPDVLSIDHIAGGGTRHKKELKEIGHPALYSYLKRNNYPKGYQILCMNCQFKKRIENREVRRTYEV